MIHQPGRINHNFWTLGILPDSLRSESNGLSPVRLATKIVSLIFYFELKLTSKRVYRQRIKQERQNIKTAYFLTRTHLVSPEFLIVPVVVIGVMIYRFRKMASGGRINRNRIIGQTILYIAISFLVALGSFQIGIPVQSLAIYIGILVGSTYLSYRFVGKSLTFWKTDEGVLHVKGGGLAYVVWLVGLAVRFALQYFFIGPDFFTAFANQKTLSATSIEITFVVDMILMIGVGALTGRNLQILARSKNFDGN